MEAGVERHVQSGQGAGELAIEVVVVKQRGVDLGFHEVSVLFKQFQHGKARDTPAQVVE
jgi:hypothetical protein